MSKQTGPAVVRTETMPGGTAGTWIRAYVDCPACCSDRHLTFFDEPGRAVSDARRFAASHNAIVHRDRN